MNQKIYSAEKNASGALKRTFLTFVPDQYGSWKNVLTGNSGYAGIEHNLIWSRYYYPGGSNQARRGIAQTSRTIERLRAAKKIDFTIKAYKTSQNAIYWTTWNDYFCLCNDFIKFDFYKYNFRVLVNGESKVNLPENTVYKVSVRQNCIYVDGVKYNYTNGMKLSDAAGNLCNSYARMDSTSAAVGAASGAHAYLEIGDLHVIW